MLSILGSFLISFWMVQCYLIFKSWNVSFSVFLKFEGRKYFRILHLNPAAIVQDAGAGNHKLKFNFLALRKAGSFVF